MGERGGCEGKKQWSQGGNHLKVSTDVGGHLDGKAKVAVHRCPSPAWRCLKRVGSVLPKVTFAFGIKALEQIWSPSTTSTEFQYGVPCLFPF
jgi:hypothetical protein